MFIAKDNHQISFLKNIIDMLREEMKWNHIKCSIKSREGIRKGEKIKLTKINLVVISLTIYQKALYI